MPYNSQVPAGIVPWTTHFQPNLALDRLIVLLMLCSQTPKLAHGLMARSPPEPAYWTENGTELLADRRFADLHAATCAKGRDWIQLIQSGLGALGNVLDVEARDESGSASTLRVAHVNRCVGRGSAKRRQSVTPT